MQGETGSAGPQGIMGIRGAGGPGVMLLTVCVGSNSTRRVYYTRVYYSRIGFIT